MKHTITIVIIFAFAASTVFGQGGKDPKAAKLTAEELIAKHVASIGTPEAIAAAKSRVLVGNGYLSGGLGIVGKIGGPAQFASQGDMVLLAMVFNSNDYAYEKVGYDGKDLSTGKAFGGNTDLGNFIRTHPVIIRQGLFGGALSAAWPLLHMEKGEKLESISPVTNNGVQLYKAKYTSSRNDDLSITLYFDAQTWRHVMTEYKYTIGPRQGGPIVSEEEKPTYYTMVEGFSNFRKVGDLVLPLTHQIDIAVIAPTDAASLRWTANYTQCYFDQELEKGMFKVS
jgi:hypothetical protein